MLCGNCGANNSESDKPCISCGKAVAQSVPPSSSKKINYASGRHGRNPHARFAAKRGFPIKTDVLPTVPVQTASAATPTLPSVPKPRPVFPDIEVPVGQATEIAATPMAPLPAKPAPQKKPVVRPQVVRPANRKPAKEPVPSLRKPPVRDNASPHTALIASAVMACATLGLSSAWWINNADIDLHAMVSNATAAGAKVFSVKTAEKSDAVTTLGLDAGKKQVASAPSDNLVIAYAPQHSSETRAPVVIEPTPASVAEPPSVSTEESGKSTIASVDKKAAPQKSRRKKSSDSDARIATVSARKDRIKEIDRFRTQAFSETRRDGMDRTPAPRYRFAPQSSKKKIDKPYQGKQLAYNTGKYSSSLSQCDNKTNLIRREQCKWQICGGKWGRDGCPSYEHKEASSIY